MLRWTGLLILSVWMIAGVLTPHPTAADATITQHFDAQIGWIDMCFAIRNDALRPGTPVTIMMFGEDDQTTPEKLLTRRAAGKITGKTTSAAKCPALIEDRRAFNQINGVSFYTVSIVGAEGTEPSYGTFEVSEGSPLLSGGQRS